MSDDRRDRDPVHDWIKQLTAPHPHAEPYTLERNGEQWQTRHHTTVPALVWQLVEAQPAGSKEESGSAHGKSRPAMHIESLDTLMWMDEEAGNWLYRLDGYVPTTLASLIGTETIRRLLKLNGLYPSTDTCGRQTHDKPKGAWCCARGHLAHDIRRWWSQARIITGWDIPAFRPRATCPVCDEHGTLRVKTEGAACIGCRSLWTADQIGLLAEHIRSENADDEGEAA